MVSTRRRKEGALMNGITIQISEIGLIYDVILRVITAILFLSFLLPLIIKEAAVRNGLRKLRYQLLVTGLIILFVNTSGLFVIVARYMGMDITKTTEWISHLNSTGFFIYVLTGVAMYRQNYSADTKKLHEKIEKMEKKKALKRKVV